MKDFDLNQFIQFRGRTDIWSYPLIAQFGRKEKGVSSMSSPIKYNDFKPLF